ncbi:SSA2 [Mytilus edulis]|uniref:TROVE2 n=1 Tax=Mytilus edulis TaxID=6550 RepID=A0A8S3RT98_MYTED|nr:SSA2 [Mytilus edulis]
MGRFLRAVTSKWYNSFKDNPMRLAYLITKYKSRHGWRHRDLLRLAHVTAVNRHIELIIKYVVQGLENAIRFAEYDTCPTTVEIIEFLISVEKTGKQTLIDTNEVKALIIKHELVQEHIHNDLLGNTDIWECLLRQMPVTAMLHNLGKMSKLHLLEGHSFFGRYSNHKT